MNNNNTGKRFHIPHAITSLRFLLAILFFYLFYQDLIVEAFCLFLLACFTDIIDGIIARKLFKCSSLGAYFDAVADFFLIFLALLAFVLKEIYPFWILLIIGFMFLQFLLTSRLKQPIYDPVGKYLGVFLFIVIGISLILPDPSVCFFLLVAIIIYTTLSLASRSISLYNSHKNPK